MKLITNAGVSLVLALAACQPAGGSKTPCPTGTLGCPCFPVGACYDGLPCLAGTCVQSGDVAGGDTSAGDPPLGDPIPTDASAGDAASGDGAAGDHDVGDAGGDDGPVFGPPAPVNAGATAWYFFAHSYRRDTGDCGGGLNCGEKQSAGNLCLKIDAVDDTETPAGQDLPETVLHADVKIVGGLGIPEIQISDQDASGPPDPAVVDAALAPLWLKRLLVPSRDHGFSTPAPLAFHTRAPPTPPAAGPAYLLCFDPRRSHDLAWGGFRWVNADCELHLTEPTCPAACRWSSGECRNGTDNLLDAILGYFVETYGVSFFVDESLFFADYPEGVDCAARTDVSACQTAHCAWDFAANGGAGACLFVYRIDLRWRHTLAAGPEELVGPVLHSLRLTYDEDGRLLSADELIMPDPSASTPLASDLVNFVSCVPPDPCASATLELDSRPWAEVYCSF